MRYMEIRTQSLMLKRDEQNGLDLFKFAAWFLLFLSVVLGIGLMAINSPFSAYLALSCPFLILGSLACYLIHLMIRPLKGPDESRHKRNLDHFHSIR